MERPRWHLMGMRIDTWNYKSLYTKNGLESLVTTGVAQWSLNVLQWDATRYVIVCKHEVKIYGFLSQGKI